MLGHGLAGGVAFDVEAHPGSAPAGLLVDRLDVGDVDRCFLLQPATLGVLPAGPHVPIHHVDPLDDHQAALRQDPEDLAALALLIASDHLHNIVASYMSSHRLSPV